LMILKKGHDLINNMFPKVAKCTNIMIICLQWGTIVLESV
jgi:hypothetical protein